MPHQRIDLSALNAVTEQFVADTLRNIVKSAEALGVAEHPEMTCIPGFRDYLTRYDAALSACEEQAAHPSAPRHLRAVVG
jgi:hypothetical protein